MSATNQTMHHSAADEVLELCTEHVSCIKTLISISLVSRRYRVAALAAAAQHPERLWQSCVLLGKEKAGTPHGINIRPVEWLCNLAGPAVGSPAVAEAALLSTEHITDEVVRILWQHGLRKIPMAALVTAAKRRMGDISYWVIAMRQQLHAPNQDIDSRAPSHIVPPVAEAILMSHATQLKPLLPQVQPSELPDLLLIAVNESWPDAAVELLDYDKQHMHVLHKPSSNSSSGGSKSSNGADTGADGSSSDTSSSSSEQCRPDLVELVEHILTTTLIRGHQQDLLPRLAALPAAQRLAPAAVSKLLFLALQLEDNETGMMPAVNGKAVRHKPCSVPALCRLAGAQGLGAGDVASMLRLCVRLNRADSAAALGQLPQADSISPQQMYQLLRRAAGQPKRRALVRALASIPAAKQIPAVDIVQLLKAAVTSPWIDIYDDFKCEDFGDALWDLSDLQLGEMLSGSHILELLRHVVAATEPETSQSWAMSQIAKVVPAAHQIEDVAGYAAFLQAALAAGHDVSDNLQETVERLPITQQLSAEMLLNVMQSSVRKISSTLMTHLLKVPAAQQDFSAANIQQLLQQVVQHRQWDLVMCLAEHPAAQQLPEAAVTEAIIAAITDSTEYNADGREEAVSSLCSLNAAQHLSAEAVLDMLTAAVGTPEQEVWGSSGYPADKAVASLVSLPAVQLISGESTAALMLAACKQGNWRVLEALRGLPRFPDFPQEQLFTKEQCSEVLVHAVQQQNGDVLRFVCGLDMNHSPWHLSPAVMEGLMQAALEWKAKDPRSHLDGCGALGKLCQLQAAKGLGPEPVMQLMHACLKQGWVAGVHHLAKLPAAAQLPAAEVEKIAMEAMGMTGSYPAIEALLLHQQQQQQQLLDPAAVWRLLEAALSHDPGQKMSQLVLLFLQLPAAQQLATASIRCLLQAALEAQDNEMFSVLKQLPAAPKDASMHALCELMQYSKSDRQEDDSAHNHHGWVWAQTSHENAQQVPQCQCMRCRGRS